MGFSFHTRHTNIVAYATTPAAEAPRVHAEDLWAFLWAIAHGDDRRWLISREPEFPRRLSSAARDALDRLHKRGDWNRVSDASEVEEILREIRVQLTGYRLYVLVVGDWEAFSARDFALESGGDALVLLPVHEGNRSKLCFEDVLPPAAALEGAGTEPGVVLWTPDGDARFVAENDFDSSFRSKLLELVRRRERHSLHELLRIPGERRGKSILHLSDLHFGRKDVSQNLGLLQTELARIGRDIDRIVITGDLLDNPRDADLALFQSFRTTLRTMTQQQVLVVPGNHDMRYLGNIGRTFEQVAQIPVTRLVVDDSMRIVFLGVNSALEGNFAKGKVTMGQLTALSAELNAELAVRPELESYLRVMMVHHHPFPYAQKPESKGWVSRVLGRKEEGVLRLEDAKEFLEWCARNRVSVVMHGHKHAARYFTKGIEVRNRRPVPITAVGCGSSLGAEGTPLSYNILRWNDSKLRWDAQFFESIGGALFEPKLITYARDVKITY